MKWICFPQPQQQTQFNFNLLFLMGRLNWMSCLLLWLPQAAYEEWNEMKLFNEARRAMEELVDFFVVGYGPPAAIMLRKERDQLNPTLPFFPFIEETEINWGRNGMGLRQTKQFMNQWREIKFIWFFFVDEMNWVGYGRWPSCSAPIPFH